MEYGVVIRFGTENGSFMYVRLALRGIHPIASLGLIELVDRDTEQDSPAVSGGD